MGCAGVGIQQHREPGCHCLRQLRPATPVDQVGDADQERRREQPVDGLEDDSHADADRAQQHAGEGHPREVLDKDAEAGAETGDRACPVEDAGADREQRQPADEDAPEEVGEDQRQVE